MFRDEEIRNIISGAVQANLTQNEIRLLLGIKRERRRKPNVFCDRRTIVIFTLLVGFGMSMFCCSKAGEDMAYYLRDAYCLVEHTLPTLEISRPLANCSMCKDIIAVPKVDHISRDFFTRHYAYSGIPLVVTNATSNWTAFKVFNFEFLKKLYNMSKRIKPSEFNDGCQFFPYLTNFKNLKDLFEMSDERASLTEDQWYVGW